MRLCSTQPVRDRPSQQLTRVITQSNQELIFGSEEPDAPILQVLSWITYLSLAICFIVNAFLPQVEMFCTGGSTPVTARFRLILLLVALTSFFITRRLRKSPISNAHIVLAAFMCVDFVVLYTTTAYQALGILNSYRVTLVPLLLFGLILSAPLNLKQRHVLGVGAILFIACITISAWQFITDGSVLPARSQDGTFVVPSYTFYGHIRAFSLFGSGLDAGVFYCIPAALGVILLMARRRRLMGFLLVSLSAFGVYTTLTRLALLGLAASICSALILWSPRLSRVAKALPLIWTLAALLTILMASGVSGDVSRTDLLRTATLHERLVGWHFYEDKYMSGNLAEVLFGTGMSEYVTSDLSPNWSPEAAPTLIDNGFLQILLNSGLVALGIVIYYYIKAWQSLYCKARNERSVFVLAAAAVFSTAPLFAAINDLPIAIFALCTIAMMIRREDMYRCVQLCRCSED